MLSQGNEDQPEAPVEALREEQAGAGVAAAEAPTPELVDHAAGEVETPPTPPTDAQGDDERVELDDNPNVIPENETADTVDRPSSAKMIASPDSVEGGGGAAEKQDDQATAANDGTQEGGAGQRQRRLGNSAGSRRPSGKAPTTDQRQRRPSGREIILRASRATTITTPGDHVQTGEGMSPTMGSGGGLGYSTGPHLNGQQLTTAEENAIFRRRNKVSTNYRGPVYVAEDVQVPCAACGGPLDPITRVPVGNLFFHAVCVRCCICGLSSITENYSQVRDTTSAICAACVAKGFEPGVRKEIKKAAQQQQQQQQQRRWQRPSSPRMTKAGTTSYNGTSLYAKLSPALLNPRTALNQPVLPGATAPSLAIGPVHNARNTSRGSFALMQRQQYYTQSDGNMIMSQSMVKPGGGGGGGTNADGYAVGVENAGDASPQRQIGTRKPSSAAADGSVPPLP